ncbi:alkylhydroperoxidase domain protein [Corynebacterium sp.]|uniref:alkylhydroperoxidase domain protein n=1 Tax=Corynebacterium sp. TaxID=1720 RepID=UPI0026DB414B|nr:alkylhydroperoxidase domain protein [Corynebacterium sp.]MDO5032898.1 alkylhydroperoxidase domain protein [Corynebacterium sp.]
MTDNSNQTDRSNQTASINPLAGVTPEIAALRARRADALTNAQLSFQALLEPEATAASSGFSHTERYAVAAFLAGLYQAGPAHEFYADLLADDAPASLISAVEAAIAHALDEGISQGPYAGGGYTTFEVLGSDAESPGLSPRLQAAFDFAHLLALHPKDASPAAIGHLQAAGWSDDEIVSLAQLIAFLSFQLRVVHGLAVLSGKNPGSKNPAAQRVQEAGQGDGDQGDVAKPAWQPHARTLQPAVHAPRGFVAHPLGWKPWVAPLPAEEFTPEHTDALIRPERISSEYFRLLARDPAALKARTLTDLDIFYNTDGGLGRAERELAATVVSRFNGCEYCASVHQQRSKEEGGDAQAIDRLLEEGVDADLGSQKWDALREAALALTRTPFAFDATTVQRLRSAGLDDLAVIDLINSAAFFNWANRLMLTLGAPDVPKRYR